MKQLFSHNGGYIRPIGFSPSLGLPLPRLVILDEIHEPYRQTGVILQQRRPFFQRRRGWRVQPVYSPVQPRAEQ